MLDQNNLMTPIQLVTTFFENAGSNFIELTSGSTSPFQIRLNEELIDIYIKNLSPAMLSNNNPDIWRIQLPVRDDFERIKNSDNLFILLGYDNKNDVYATWNPYWCKQRLNVGKSVSLYSRFSLQKEVAQSQMIKQIDLNNNGSVVCMPASKVIDYIKNIKLYYPEKTEFLAKGSSIQKRLRIGMDKLFEEFLNFPLKVEDFVAFLIANGMTEKSAKDYKRYLTRLFSSGLLKKYRVVFSGKKSYSEYLNALKDLFEIEEMALINKKRHRYYSVGLKHYVEFLLFEKSDPIVKPEQNGNYPVNEYGKLLSLSSTVAKQLAKYIVGEEFPDYGSMIDIVCTIYPKYITDSMNCTDWIALFKKTNFRDHSQEVSNKQKRSTRNRLQNLRVTYPDGTVVSNKYAVDTYLQVIENNFPDLISEIKIQHAGVDLISTQYDPKYRNYQRIISGGYLVMTNSTTKQKFNDLKIINDELGLDLKIELLEVE